MIAFYIFWHEPIEKDLSSITVRHSENTAVDPEFNLLEAVINTFSLEDAGDTSLTIPSTTLEEMYQTMIIPTNKKEEKKYGLKGFSRIWLKPEFLILFNVVHWVLLSQTGTKTMSRTTNSKSWSPSTSTSLSTGLAFLWLA